jgi:hypothetical protein
MRTRMAVRSLMLLFALVASVSAFASHFRYGLITATRLSETTTTVTYRLNVSMAWRLTQAPTSVSFSISGGNTGSVLVPISNVTDPSGQWTNSTGAATVTLNKNATATRITYTGCCKISTIVNNHDLNWDVNVVLRTNQPGSSPVSTLPAIINMPINAAAATYTVPASDPDAGSTLTYGAPVFSGNLLNESNPVGFSVNPTTGLITFDTRGKALNQQYNAMVTVIDNHGNQIMLDFLINMVGASTPPAFDYTATPANGAVFNVIAGQNISFPIRATDADANSTVGFSVSGLPSYITTSNFSPALPATGNPARTTFSWTPAAAQIGSTVVLNFIATDNVGVQSTSSVTIRVVAEPAPVFNGTTPAQNSIRQVETGTTVQDEITAQSSLGSNVSIAFATVPAGASLSPAVPTVGANPGTTTMTWTPTPANWGVHNISFQATISNLPTIFATRNYQLIANTTPAFASTPATTVNAGQPFVYNIVVNDPDIAYGDQVDVLAQGLPSWLTLVDNHNGTATLSGTPSMNDGGTYTIALEAEDTYHHGNASEVTQEFDLVVIACTPTATAQDVTVYLDANGNATVDAAQVNNGSSDNCGIQSISVSPASFTCADRGTQSVTLTVTNIYGISSTATATVTVADNSNPTITAPAAVSVNTNDGCTATAVDLGTAVTADNCSVASVSNDAPAAFPTGTTTVTWTVVDASGNSATATQQVTVTDVINPVISNVSADISVSADAGNCGAIVNWSAPVATDNCSALLSQTAGAVSGSAFPVGTTTISYDAVDPSGNHSTASFNITVTDNEAPALQTPAAQFFCFDGNTYSIPALSASDNCAVASVSYSISGATTRSGAGSDASGAFAVGTSTITWTVTDIHGNSSNATTDVTVNAPVSANIPGVYAVSPGGLINTVYIGYGPASVNLSAHAAGGTPGYRYNWSNGAASQSISVAPATAGNHSYSVAVTDSKGCVTARATISVRVIDVRCGNKNDKVSVCQKTGSATNPWVQICVAPAAVATHLANGSTLGLCGSAIARGIGSSVSSEEVVAVNELLAFPNPSRGAFTVEVKAAKATKMVLVVVNAMGTEVARKELSAKEGRQLVSFDLGHLSSGVYMIKMLGEGAGQSTRVLIRH